MRLFLTAIDRMKPTHSIGGIRFYCGPGIEFYSVISKESTGVPINLRPKRPDVNHQYSDMFAA